MAVFRTTRADSRKVEHVKLQTCRCFCCVFYITKNCNAR